MMSIIVGIMWQYIRYAVGRGLADIVFDAVKKVAAEDMTNEERRATVKETANTAIGILGSSVKDVSGSIINLLIEIAVQKFKLG